MDSKGDADKKALEMIMRENRLFAETTVDGKDICFNITNKMSLKKYLGNVLGKREVLDLLTTILEAADFTDDAGLDPGNLILDVDLMLVDYDTAKVSTIYLPAKTHTLRNKTLRAFIKEILVNTIYDERDDLSFVGRLITYVNKNKVINNKHMLSFVDGLRGAESRPEPEPQSAAVDIGALQTGAQAEEPEAVTEFRGFPYIIREKTGERISIEKDEFMIGKIAGIADCLLTDNPTVSRMHAIIRKIGNTYYVCDNYSTNATFLNGEKLEAGKDYVLLNGARLSFANDKFTYFDR